MQANDIALRIGPISPTGSGPLYQQIVDGFKREIGDNRLFEGVPLPSFRLMAKQPLVSVITVKRAYEELEAWRFFWKRRWKKTKPSANKPKTMAYSWGSGMIWLLIVSRMLLLPLPAKLGPLNRSL